MKKKCFNIDFTIDDYADILPDIDDYCKHDEIINAAEYHRGEFNKCVWKRQAPPLVITREFIEREVTRILRTGVWIMIKEECIWIPPNYYEFLQYFDVAGAPAQFRLKRLKHVYFKIRVRNNPKALGTYTIKNRQDGETTMAMSDCLFEAADGNMDSGSLGMQSKTRDTVMLSCWRTLIMGWNAYPQWLKRAIYSDCVSGDKTAETLKFIRPRTDDDAGRNVLITYGPSVHNAFDSLNNMRRCVLDEINKWIECSFYATFLNYKQFIAPGTSRKGLFDIFSSPADKNGRNNDEAYEFWQKSDPNDLEDGTTKTRIFRYYSDPLEGVEGFYDIWGDVDANQIHDWIQKERKSVAKDKLMGEVRAYPLNEEEMFGATESGSVWSNHAGIQKRHIYLLRTRYKDSETKEPVRIYGNLERVDGYVDGEVEFRAADVEDFDEIKARWCFSYLPQHREPLKSIFKPPQYVENVLGIDPFNNRYNAKNKGKQSMGAMSNLKFRDIHNTGVNKAFTMLYVGRPSHIEIFFEDAIKSAIFCRAPVQFENRSDKLANYFEDRGYFDWLLAERGAPENSKRKGDAPSGSGKFMDEVIGLIDAFTNIPLTPQDQYNLDYVWFPEMCLDWMKFNPLDTHANDISMCTGQALLGAVKILHKKAAQNPEVARAVLNYLLS